MPNGFFYFNYLAFGLLQVRCVEELGTAIALISPRVLIAAKGAGALNETIGKKTCARLAKQLLDILLAQKTPAQVNI